jgi:hypothetical protein
MAFDTIAAKKAGYTEEEIAQYLASNTEFDYQGAIKSGYKPNEILTYLNRTGATPFETFKAAAAQEVGSEVRGIAQMLGREPTDTAEESRARQMEAENPASGLAGRIVGGLVNPSTLLPGAMFGKGAKALVQSGAAAGGISGFLQPQYTEEDLGRVASTAVGAVGGATIVGALLGGTKAVQKVINKLTGKVEEIPTTKLDPEIHTPTEPTKVQESFTPSGNPIPDVVKLQDNNPIPLIQAIEDAEIRTKVEEDLSQGNFSSFFSEVPFRTTDIPVFRAENAFGEDNPYRQVNIDARAALGLKQLTESEKMLDVIYKLMSPQLRAELDNTTISKVFPQEVAQQLAMLRKKEEVLPVEVIRALDPVINNATENIKLMSELYEQGVAQGLKPDEVLTMFAPEMAAYRSLWSVYGSASNAAKALRQQQEVIKQVGFGVPELRAYLKAQGKEDFKGFGDFMDAVSAIRKSTDPFINKNGAINDLASRTLNTPGWNDKFGEFTVNSYISGLSTLSVNALSGIAKIGLLSAEKFLNALNPLSAVKLGEVIPAYKGLMQGAMEGLYFAKEGFIKGTPLDADLTDISGSRLAGAIGTSPDSSKFAKLAGRVIRTPGKASVGIDEFFKSVFRRMELNALAFRMADSGKYGDPETVFRILKNVDTKDKNWKDNIYKAEGISGLSDTAREALVKDVTRFAKQATFQADLGDFGRKIVAARAQHPGLAWLIPFVKTPINIMKDAVSYTPLGFAMREVVGYNSQGKAILRAIPTDVRMARTAMGLGVVLGLGDLLENNQITGSYPNDPAERAKWMAAQIPEYSIKIGDQWVSYARLEPIATVVGSSVDGLKAFKDFAKKPSYDQKKGQELAIDLVSGITKNIASKTFLEGISNFMQAAHDPTRYGQAFVNSFAGLVVPSIVAAPARGFDPNSRIVTSFGEAVANRLPNVPGLGEALSTATLGYIPGTREALPIASNIFGGERPNPSTGFAAITGIQTAPANQSLLQNEVVRVNFKYSPVDKSLKDVDLNPQDQAMYQKLASDYADRILNRVVETPGYQNAADPMKRYILEQYMKKARSAATKEMFSYKLRDPEYRAQYIIEQRKKRGLEE